MPNELVTFQQNLTYLTINATFVKIEYSYFAVMNSRHCIGTLIYSIILQLPDETGLFPLLKTIDFGLQLCFVLIVFISLFSFPCTLCTRVALVVTTKCRFKIICNMLACLLCMLYQEIHKTRTQDRLFMFLHNVPLEMPDFGPKCTNHFARVSQLDL